MGPDLMWKRRETFWRNNLSVTPDKLKVLSAVIQQSHVQTENFHSY